MSQNNTRKQHTRKELNSIIDKKDEQINQLKEEIKGLNCKIDELRDNIIKLSSKTDEEKAFEQIVKNLHGEIEVLQEVILFYQEQAVQIKKLEDQIPAMSDIIKENIKSLEGNVVINFSEIPELYDRLCYILYMQLDYIYYGSTNIFYWPVKKKMEVGGYIILLDHPKNSTFKMRIWGIQKNLNLDTVDLGEWCLVCSPEY